MKEIITIETQNGEKIKNFLEKEHENYKVTSSIQEISLQPKTLEICPKCGTKCSLKVTEYRNLRCWQVKCQGCDYFSYASTKRS